MAKGKKNKPKTVKGKSQGKGEKASKPQAPAKPETEVVVKRYSGLPFFGTTHDEDINC